MNIEINETKHEIKPASELTVKEYIDYFQSLTEDSGSFEQLVNYIAVITDSTVENVAKVNISEQDIIRLGAYIGGIYGYNHIPEKSTFYYKRKGRTLYQNSIDWRTLGARYMLEQKSGLNMLEQCVYLLAIYTSSDYDAGNINKIYDELMGYRAYDVFGFIVFFFKKLVNGALIGKN